MRLSIATPQAIRFACMKYHYAKAVPSSAIAYNVFNSKDEWCGVIIYGGGSNNHIGCEYNLVQGQVLELVRVALNGKQEITSQALAMSIKQVKKDFPLCKLLISYADCDQDHLGTIYQATNWIYCGCKYENAKDGAFIVNGKKIHSRTVSALQSKLGGLKEGQSRLEFVREHYSKDAIAHITKGKRKYLFPITKDMKKLCQSMSLPYPKNDGWVKIDRMTFKHERIA